MMALPLADTMKGERPSCHLLLRDTWSATDLKVGLHLTGSVTKLVCFSFTSLVCPPTCELPECGKIQRPTNTY